MYSLSINAMKNINANIINPIIVRGQDVMIVNGIPVNIYRQKESTRIITVATIIGTINNNNKFRIVFILF